MPLRKRLRFFLNYFVGPVLFIVMAISIYRQVQHQEDWAQKWQIIKASLVGNESWRLYVVLALMLVNWGLEARKWQLLLRHMNKISFTKAYKSVLSGVAFTMVTPNRMGEFIGRVFYVEDGQRIRAATLTIVGSISQLIITLLAGTIGLFVLKEHIAAAPQTNNLTFFAINGLLFGTLIAVILMLLFYFKISWLVRMAEKRPSLQKYVYFVALLDNFKATELLGILSLSAIRFTVFVLQYMLLFTLFDVDIPWWQGCCAVSVMFLILAVIPMPGIAELGIRGKASIALFMSFSNNPVGILVTTGSIWLINIILPAVLGSLLILNVKLFTKNDVPA
ncbi:MAG: lysylphosphatidylglycerol synthase transmembrane domain-containing protein [Bacteroidota bacterium]